MIKALPSENAVAMIAATKSRLTAARVVDEYGEVVYKFCRSITRTKEDADDLFQDTFLKVFSQLSKIEIAENQQSFLLSAAAFLWKSQRRKYTRHNRIAPEVEINETTDIGIVSTSMEDDFMTNDEQRIVRDLVEVLPIKLKIPIVMYYANELSIADISALLKLPEGTVKSRLHKARTIIKKGLVSDYGY